MAHSSVRGRSSDAVPQLKQRVGSPGTRSATSIGESNAIDWRQSDVVVIFMGVALLDPHESYPRRPGCTRSRLPRASETSAAGQGMSWI